MPGAQDRWGQLTEPSAPKQEVTAADRPQFVDRPERGSLAEMRQRLERLPPGHPSSPYNDDLTPKPPVARLKDLELPLQGNGHGANGAATRYEPDPAEKVPATARAEPAISPRWFWFPPCLSCFRRRPCLRSSPFRRVWHPAINTDWRS